MAHCPSSIVCACVRPSVHPSTISKNNFSRPLKPLIGFWPNFTGMIPRWSSTKIVQIVPVGCVSTCRSQGQKTGFRNAIFKNLVVWNYKAQSFHIWYISLSRGPLPKVLPGGHNFTLNYRRKTSFSNYFLSWTTYGNLTKLSRNNPCSPTKLLKWFWLVARKNVQMMPLV